MSHLSLSQISAYALSHQYVKSDTTIVRLGLMERLIRTIFFLVPGLASSAQRCCELSIRVLTDQLQKDLSEKTNKVPEAVYEELRSLQIGTIQSSSPLYNIRSEIEICRAYALEKNMHDLETLGNSCRQLEAENAERQASVQQASEQLIQMRAQLSSAETKLKAATESRAHLLAQGASREVGIRTAQEDALRPAWIKNARAREFTLKGDLGCSVVLVGRGALDVLRNAVGPKDCVILSKADEGQAKLFGNKVKTVTYKPSKNISKRQEKIAELMSCCRVLRADLDLFVQNTPSVFSDLLETTREFMSNEFVTNKDAAVSACEGAKNDTQGKAALMKLEKLEHIRLTFAQVEALQKELVELESSVHEKLVTELTRAMAESETVMKRSPAPETIFIVVSEAMLMDQRQAIKGHLMKLLTRNTGNYVQVNDPTARPVLYSAEWRNREISGSAA
ncbi:MAG: hypothetical protein H0X51_09805 [Parachlamydiaceae bacterium]|nr:hypothetical protein [Parachlamydiaceae bacterium]